MKEKHIIILIICISALLRSCNTPDNIFCDTSILITKFETEISSEGKLITDTLFFANNLFAFDDKILIINGSNAQYLFQLFDNEFNVNIANFGSYGRANSEFLSNRFLNNLQNSSEGNTVLWICDHNKKAIKALDVSSSLIENKSVVNMEFEIPVVMPVATFIANDSIMVCLGLLKNNLRLVNVDLNNGKLLIDTKFYKLNAIKDVQTTFIGGWSITPDGTKLVNCMSSFNQLNICKIDGTNRKSVSFEEYPKSIESALNNDDLPVYYYYVNVICDNNYIYALYCNTDYSVMDNENIDTQLHIFDHNLNPIKKVELDKNIFQITIGNTPNIIYALDYENKIWKYNI